MIEEMQQNELLRELIRQELLKNTLESIRFASLGLGSERIKIVEKIFSGDIDHGVCATNDVLRFIANKLNQPAYSLLNLPANNLCSESEFVSYDPVKNGLNIVKHGLEFHGVHSYSNGTFGRLIVPTGNQSKEERFVIFSKYKITGSKSPYLPSKIKNRDEIFVATVASPRGSGFRFISSSILSSNRKRCEERVFEIIKDVVEDETQMNAVRSRSMEILDDYYFK